jgi:hypothetical protein
VTGLSLACWLILTWVPVSLLLHLALPTTQPGRWSIVLGYGVFLNMISITLLMRALDLAGVNWSFAVISACVVAVTVVAGLLIGKRPAVGHRVADIGGNPVGSFGKALALVCLALIVVRLASLGVELTQRPVFAWDSKQHWGKQAKVLFDAGAIVSYVSLQEWLELADPAVFTNMHPDYPVTVPLLHVWANLPYGAWDDSLMNLPWLLALFGMGLIFYGQLRFAGAGVVVAIACTYMMLSLPYMNTQIALAGYADVIMGVCYLGAIAAFHNWSVTRLRWQGVLAVLLAISCILIKNEGFYWLLSFVPGVLLVAFGWRKGLAVIVGLLVVLLGGLFLLPGDLVIAGHSLDSLALAYRPESWLPILTSFFIHDNWHLLAYTLPLLLLVAIFAGRGTLLRVAPTLVTLLGALACYLALYLLTRHAYGAVNFTSLNRVALHLMPSMALLAALLFAGLEREFRQEVQSES